MNSRQPDHEKSLFFEEEGFWEEDEALDEPALDLEIDIEESPLAGVEFLHEAHEAVNRLAQKTHTRAKVDRHPRRADSWH